ncbi:PEP-CTERM sorting domain-containing protein [Massilia sp. METH4]|uniref:PEP-CTERM sorting domain-containing protein n=1 Tax=Massilia sp. METH4 TaxID=3123041 RepID=UPI0030CD18A0
MLRPLLFAAVAASAIPAHAETWHFQYRGFYDSVNETFLPDRELTGSFVGHDSNGDGTLVLDEISSFMLNNFDFVDCRNLGNPYYKCGMDGFTYSDGALYFTAGISSTDPEGLVGGGHYFTTGDREYRYEYTPNHIREWEYRWTDQTRLTISPAPEPSTWALLLAGVPLTVLAVRSRRKRD